MLFHSASCCNSHRCHFCGWNSSNISRIFPVPKSKWTNREPTQLSGRIKFRKVLRGEVIIAHTYGPYDQVGQAYMQIEKWLKENNRKAKSAPFEVYVNDPDLVKSPEEIQTDVYQPVE